MDIDHCIGRVWTCRYSNVHNKRTGTIKILVIFSSFFAVFHWGIRTIFCKNCLLRKYFTFYVKTTHICSCFLPKNDKKSESYRYAYYELYSSLEEDRTADATEFLDFCEEVCLSRPVFTLSLDRIDCPHNKFELLTTQQFTSLRSSF